MRRARVIMIIILVVMFVKPDLNLAIAGAGVHALTLALHLIQKRKNFGDRFLAFDPSGSWLSQWHRQFAMQEIPHLRSPAVHHPAPDAFNLRSFAESRTNELHPPYDLPSTELFEDFCKQAIQEFKVNDRVVKATITRLEPLDPHFRLWLDDGNSLVARRVILATNKTFVQIPEWVNKIAESYPKVRLVHSHSIDLRSLGSLFGEKIIIVGGGLTSGHLAMGAINRGAKVGLMSRRKLKAKVFDAEPGWLGPKYLKGFEAETDWEKRRQMVISARDGGSLTPEMLNRLEQANRSGQVDFYENCEVMKAEWKGNFWRLICEDGMELNCDRLWLATGTKFDVKADPLLTEIIEQFPIEVVGGFPIIDPCLRWKGCELFLMGGLAALQVGPTARNISGARMASDRIIPALI